MNKEDLKQIKNLLIKLNIDVSNYIELETELDAYKYVVSSDFVNKISDVINENNLHDIVAEYIELARNVAKYKIYEDIELIQDITKINIIQSLWKNWIQWVIDLLYDYVDYCNNDSDSDEC